MQNLNWRGVTSDLIIYSLTPFTMTQDNKDQTALLNLHLFLIKMPKYKIKSSVQMSSRSLYLPLDFKQKCFKRFCFKAMLSSSY